MANTFQTTDKSKKQVTVSLWSIKREDYENGAYLNCVCCGAAIRHIMTIDNANYGQVCGARELGWEVKKSRNVDKVLFEIQHLAEKLAWEAERDARIAVMKANGTLPKPLNAR